MISLCFVIKCYIHLSGSLQAYILQRRCVIQLAAKVYFTFIVDNANVCCLLFV